MLVQRLRPLELLWIIIIIIIIIIIYLRTDTQWCFCAWVTPRAVTSVSERSVVLQQQISSGEDLPGCTINHSNVKISCWLISVSWMRLLTLCWKKKRVLPAVLLRLVEDRGCSCSCQISTSWTNRINGPVHTVIFRKRSITEHSRGGWRNACS